MRKSVEIKKSIAATKDKMEKLHNEGDFETAAALADDLNKMLDELKAAEAVEKSEEPNNSADDENDDDDKDSDTTVKNSYVQVGGWNKTKLAKLRNRAFNKLVLGKRLTDEEKQAYFNEAGQPGQVESIDTKGGFLVPEEQLNILEERRRAYTALKDYCHVMIAHSKSGNFPTMEAEKGTLFNFDELKTITKSDIDFGQVEFKICSYGDIIPVSNELIEDANVSILDIIGQRLARKAVNTENAEIIKLLKGMTATSISGYKNLMKAINVDLDPIFYADAHIFTNQDGMQWMSELEDAQKRPLLVPDVSAPDSYKFRGKPIVVLPNSQLSMSAAIPFYIGSLKDFCKFFERKGVEISVSKEYLFGENATAFRCVERFGVSKDDEEALKAYKVTTGS